MIRNKNIICNNTEVLVPVELNFGALVLSRIVEYKDNVCLINAETKEQLTYGSLLQQCMNIAVSLTHLGVRKGQTVAIISSNRNEFLATALGIICSGATLTTFNPTYTSGELKHVLNISKPRTVFCSPESYKNHMKVLKSTEFIKTVITFGNKSNENTILYNNLAFPSEDTHIRTNKIFDVESKKLVRNIHYDEFQVPDVEGQNDIVLILYSSGTTGLPKGVMLTHVGVITSCSMLSQYTVKDVVLSITPWYHAMGLCTSLIYTVKGRVVVYLPTFSLDLYLRTIQEYKIVQLTLVPPIIVAMCKADFQYDLSSVKVIHSGAAPLHGDTVADVSKKFPNAKVIQGYGMTESTLAVTRDNLEAPKAGSVGYVLPTCAVKVADLQTGEALGPYKHGEICIKGPLIMKGYIGIDSKQWRDDEGFYHSGDIGYYDEDRCFFIVDRLKELIKYKGFQVPPAEIEAVLLTHPSVKDVGVVGRDHKSAGEVPVAFVVRQPGCDVTEDDLKALVAEKLSNPKHLRGGVKFVNDIPKNPSGKILRRDLKRMLKSEKSKL